MSVCDTELPMKLFFRVAEQLDGLCFEQLGVASKSSVEFGQLGETVERYLSRGVVPSTLNVDGIVKRPSEATLINASRRFNLVGLKTLLDNLDSPQSVSARTYAKWSRQVESWILKALEDVELLKES